jgi:hypothetical protein
MRILLQESVVLASCVVVLTTVLTLAQWRTGATINPALVMLGLRFGVTAYVLAGIIRLMLQANNRFKKWSQGNRVCVAKAPSPLPRSKKPDGKKLENRSTAVAEQVRLSSF